ncbi:uncharacterized protein LOC121404376 [Drosophila obscura]|uniref:uncharacterized protein LOC121404376 n=1 Tax=Drosophila obscura TaxID=7282 RepID=UPI001BB0F9CC|nr:uncharacterized protein LOC121404376 [Drosophila obscura]
MVDRFNRTLLIYLAKFVDDHQRNWDERLPWALWAYRAAVHEATGFSPAKLTFRREVRLPCELLYGRPTPDTESYPAFVGKLQSHLRETHHAAREHLKAAADQQKDRYDLRSHTVQFETGDLAWLYAPVRKVGRCPKLQSDWIGPATVIRSSSDLVYEIRLPGKRATRTVHVNRLASYKEPVPE